MLVKGVSNNPHELELIIYFVCPIWLEYFDASPQLTCGGV